MSEFMVTFDGVPHAAFFDGAVDAADRLRLLRFFHAEVELRLTIILSRFDVTAGYLAGVAAVIVRGSPETLALVRADAEFQTAGVTVSEDVKFVALVTQSQV